MAMIPEDISTPVLLLKMEHYGSLGIVRSLGRWGVEVFGADGNSQSPGFASRYCRKSFLLDVDGEDEGTAIERVIDIGRALHVRTLLIPTSDETTRLVYRNAARLTDYFVFPEVSYELIRAMCDKQEMHVLCRAKGIPTAATRFPRSREHAVHIADDMTYPLVLKGIDGGRLERRCGRKMTIVSNRRQFLESYFAMEDPEHPNLMIQEYIPAHHNNDWMFNGYFDTRHSCRIGMTGRKLRQNPIYTGMTSLGVCERNDDVAELAQNFMQSLGYRGIVDIDFRFDARSGSYKVLDINPRVGATFRLFVARNGLDVVRAMYLDMTGQPIPRAVPQEGRKWFVEDKDLLSSFRYHADGKLTVIAWLRSLRGIREAGYFAWDDLRPFLRLLVNHLRKRVFRLLRPDAGKRRTFQMENNLSGQPPEETAGLTLTNGVSNERTA